MKRTKIRVELELSDEDHARLVSQAVKDGFVRDVPRRGRRDREVKDAIRFRVLQLVAKELGW